MQLEQLLSSIIEAHKSLEAYKQRSPEIAEALAISERYHGLMQELRQMCSDIPAQIVPYPVYPPIHPCWQLPAISTTDTTAPIDLTPKVRLVK